MATVLLVDDEPALRSVLAEFLTFAGYNVVAAANADEALERAQSAHVDIIVSDVLMPGTDGVELCRRMRAQQSFAKIPFLYMTARNVDEQLAAILAATGDGNIPKPFEPSALIAAIREALERKATASAQPARAI